MSTYMNDLLRLSNEYGSDERYVVKGGGNTSVKDGAIMYVKASGEPLSTIKKSGFVKMKLSTLETLFGKTYSPNQEVREKEVLQDLMDARFEGETMRPSVEALLHSFIPFRFVVHLHPAIVNGLTCSLSGKEAMKQLFKNYWS
ncbi:MAG: class II aldolase [Spirochaetia bacterium]|nr:class II aldolase [Spirochaetia bacterium]